jgi:hypothetical protein
MNADAHPPPSTDDDTSEVIDDSVSALAERRGLWLGTDATVIHLLASLIAQAERELPLAVTTARDKGCSGTTSPSCSGPVPTRPGSASILIRPSPMGGGPSTLTDAPPTN